MHVTFLQNTFFFILVCFAMLCSACAVVASAADHGVPDDAMPWPELSSESVTASIRHQTVWLQLSSDAVNNRKAVIRRVAAPIRSIGWIDDPTAELKFWPEQEEWIFSWKVAPKGATVLEVVFDRPPLFPDECPAAVPEGDGSVMLHAYQANAFGEKLRFEPQWYKNTVGYWAVGTDYATWNLSLDQPGTYSVAVLQGCGKDQGGSEAVISFRQGDETKAELPFRTIDTGHFQNFRWNHLGMVQIADAGAYQLRIDAKRIAKVALFDVRAIHLVPQAAPVQKSEE